VWFLRFKQTFYFLLIPWLISVIIQSLGRFYLTIKFTANLPPILTYHEIFSLFVTGLKLDIRTASIVFGTLLLLSCLVLFSNYLYQYWKRHLLIFSVLFSLIFCIFTLINIGYFTTYNRHIDVFIFGLIDDDTVAILKTIWQSYPVIRGTILLIIMLLFFSYFYRCWQSFVSTKVKKINKNWFAIPSIIIILSITFIGCRGSLGKFPLRKSDSQVSNNTTVNMFVPNGLIALSWAYSDYQVENSFTKISTEKSQQLLQNFFKQKQQNSPNIFISQTKANDIASNKPPHVIFSVMESMGSHLFEFDNDGRDMLGALRPHLKEDWFFPRFISEGDGTIDSLNRFFVRSPINKISQSSAQSFNFTSNMFKPFLDNDYKVIFITSGNGGWRNLNQFLPNLGVTEFIEQNTLKNTFPEAPIFTWGVPDEYMFKYAEQRLEQAEQNGEHLMIMMMSTTNHPPYAIPDNYQYVDYKLSETEKQRFSHFGPEQEVKDLFNTFHYSNDQLGLFISSIKAKDLAKHTIIAFTGDHNTRGIGYPDPKETVLEHAVPFHIYVPSDYQKDVIYDNKRVGSHKDIFPTLYQLSLSKTHYYRTGCNLLAKDLDPIWCNVGYNPHVYINKDGAYLVQAKEFRNWANKSDLNLQLEEPVVLTGEDAKEIKRWNNFTDLLQWQIVEQINQNK